MTRVVLLSLWLTHPGSSGLRPLAPADLFRIEKLGEVVPSPDGKLFAYVRIRGKATAKFHMRDFMDGLDRADVWVARLDGGEPRNITTGATDGSGWFLPTWSPDSRKLAMLSTRGDDIHLWIWEPGSGRIRQVSAETVQVARPAWLSPDEIVCAGVANGRKPSMFEIEVRAPEQAMRLWPQAWRGAEPTVSVARSGTGGTAEGPAGQLWKFDLRRGSAASLGQGDFSSIIPAPDGRRIAALRATSSVRPEPGKLLPNRNPAKYSLVVIDDPSVPAVQDVVPGSLRWTRGGKLVLQARTNARADWIIAGGANLTASLPAVPATLVPCTESDSFVAVVDGRLQVLTADGAAPRLFNPDFGPQVNAIAAWDPAAVVVSAGADLYAIDLKTRAFGRLPRPAPNAEFKAFSLRTGASAFTATSRAGTYLWLSRTGEPPRTIVSTNEFLQQIAEGTLRRMDYQGLDGRPLTGWLLLPPNYTEGQRCPTAVWVYGGLTYSDSPPRFGVQISDAGTYNLQLLAAHGYAVLLPSMPLKPEGQPSDPYLDLANGVLPAVDKAIELGIADSKRLAIMGQSFGGYSVYGLVTQTPRFQAAIALAGICNLVSLYGAFDVRFRFDETAREHLLHMVFAESGQFRMAAPPWKDMDRYVRNSPIAYADRVTTPLMIVQGDMDYVPIQQGEEFFTALYRQNKPASFVRYWGEGHLIESPANVADMWARIYEWLGRYLR